MLLAIDAPIHRHTQSPLCPPLGPEALELGVWQQGAGYVSLNIHLGLVGGWAGGRVGEQGEMDGEEKEESGIRGREEGIDTRGLQAE